MPQYLTLQAGAEQLGVTDRTLINWARAGKLTIYRTPGGMNRVRADELESLMTVRPMGGAR